MLKKWLASVGIGSAKVDTRLDNDHLTAGEPFSGKVVIEGGNTDQQVNQIRLFVMTEAVQEKDDRKVYKDVILASFSIDQSFTVKEGERKEISFEDTLPVHTPPTLGRTKVWVQTGLDVPNAIDPNDRDYITVEPHPFMRTALDCLTNELGFHLRKVEMEFSRRHEYIQEFEFYPGGEFRGDLDELEAMFFMGANQLEIVLQVDRRAKGLGGLFAEALDMDESFVRMTLTEAEINEGVAAVAEKFRQTIRQFR
ncbi:sporulation protein [Virgibacillus sp. MSP4-1]|uniref:sporulation protein n=1 Tax=Virgibacillus sp. MSP4-1 TaxID=2700081 RepID=UPI0003A10A61|nr:sporulation protein [Virgibacillus sp. MSP4-1]QHS22026.1 sporulation protein [Virgibacillus sp. MSP4-1]